MKLAIRKSTHVMTSARTRSLPFLDQASQIDNEMIAIGIKHTEEKNHDLYDDIEGAVRLSIQGRYSQQHFFTGTISKVDR